MRKMLIVLLLSSSVAIAEETETTVNAYAAGYVANFTCSAVFNANKDLGSDPTR